tara:strand:- start:422 stop:748 length:327 start_codon:yes stop_codon:yes gene_type:complete
MTGDEILDTFKDQGMRIELGAQFSVRGQIAQLLNGVSEIQDAEKFTVIAGKYDDGYIDAENPLGENIKFASDLMDLDSAIETAKEYYGYHFVYIEYSGQRLSLSLSGT